MGPGQRRLVDEPSQRQIRSFGFRFACSATFRSSGDKFSDVVASAIFPSPELSASPFLQPTICWSHPVRV
jgi:hypothetical protein